MNCALIVTWRTPDPGREKLALGRWDEVNEYWGKLTAEGKCSVPEMFFFRIAACGWSRVARTRCANSAMRKKANNC